MAGFEDTPGRVIPAHLDFLAIYNPELGRTEETEQQQIVFYHSQKSFSRKRRKAGSSLSEDEARKETNEELRQVGLAQGMVNFARGFSNGATLDSVESEKHRIVLTELEQGWWILASVNFTRLPVSKGSKVGDAPQYEYSPREVSSPELLIQQLLRAQRIFLIHHGLPMDELYIRLARDRFCNTLESYWTQFALNWDVLLHGNPAAEIFGGIKLAAGGELGIGVGEEEWGSGEREVLEGLIRNTDGLEDLIVYRYGGLAETLKTNRFEDELKDASTVETPWLGTGQSPGPADGLLFSGVGTITRSSTRSLVDWTQDVCMYHEDAYGVASTPSSARKKRRKKRPPALDANVETGRSDQSDDGGSKQNDTFKIGNIAKTTTAIPNIEGPKPSTGGTVSTDTERGDPFAPGIPPPIVATAEESLRKVTMIADGKVSKSKNDPKTSHGTIRIGSPDLWMNVLTLGYKSGWAASPKDSKAIPPQSEKQAREETNSTSEQNSNVTSTKSTSPSARDADSRVERQPQQIRGGHFIIGLKGDLDADDKPTSQIHGEEDEEEEPSGWSSRLSIRTIHLARNRPISSTSEETNQTVSSARPTPNGSSTTRLRVVIYAHRPFLYTLLFNLNNTQLAMPSFFHDLHHHLTPLHAPLLRSTDPSNIAARLASALYQSSTRGANPIYDLIYSPVTLTVRSSIPNIPAPGTLAAEGLSSGNHGAKASMGWTRVEALSLHGRILDTLAETRARDVEGAGGRHRKVCRGEIERTIKTSRGWWVVWTRVSTKHGTSPVADSRASSRDGHPPLAGSNGSSTTTLDLKEEDELDAHVENQTEALLIRRSEDSASASGRWGGGRYAYGFGRKTSQSVGPSALSSSTTTSAGPLRGMGWASMGMGLAPFARFAGRSTSTRVDEPRVSETSTGNDVEDGGAEETSVPLNSAGAIGVDVRSYVEGLLSLNR